MDGEYCNLQYHTMRMQRAWKDIFHVENPFNLVEVLRKQPAPATGLFKCRIIYDTKLTEMAFERYGVRKVHSLKMIHDNEVSYEHKFNDRGILESHFKKRDHCDDVLIIKKGLVTDTSYANIIFKRKEEWFTPATCLLPGTMRQQMIDNGKIQIMVMKANQISLFEKFKLINSMLLDEGPEIDVSNII